MKKISCVDCQKKIDDYIAHNLNEEELDCFIYHVKDCAECMDELSINYSVITALDQLNHNQELSEDYDKEIQGQIKRYVDKKKKIRMLFAIAVSLLFIGSVFLGIIGSVFVYDKPIEYSKDSNATVINFEYRIEPVYMDNVQVMIDKYNADLIDYLHGKVNNE